MIRAMAPRPKAPPTCKHCMSPAKRLVVRGRNKGWLRTCGSAKCLDAQHRDPKVIASKRPVPWLPCELCVVNAAVKRFCLVCVPNKKWRRIAQRYGIGKPQWEMLLMKQVGHCALCPLPAEVVDHDHQSGQVRGLLCYRCNLLLAGLDADPSWFSRAKEYVDAVRK